jgi:hypothetical protein
MTSRFIFSDEAETQLLEILDYLADENQQRFACGTRFTTLSARTRR